MVGVTVVGSANVDVVVDCPRLPRPGETVMGRGVARWLGGKGVNQAVAAAKVAGDVSLFAAVGADDAGAFVREQLRDCGLNDARLFVAEAPPTGTAFIAVDDAGNNS